MADFLEGLLAQYESRKGEFADLLRAEATAGESDYERLVRRHWAPLPAGGGAFDWPACAVDGSVRSVGLDSGSTYVVVRALCIGGDGFEKSAIEAQILPAAMDRQTASRVTDLLQQNVEIGLAASVAEHFAPPGSVVFLDGALYGRLPHLFPLALEDAGSLSGLPEQILTRYLSLLDAARRRDIRLIAVSKTSREATHFKLWRRAERAAQAVAAGGGDATATQAETEARAGAVPLTDSQMIHRWTDRSAGISTPVVLGTWSFTGGSSALLDRPEVAASPAIASCFVRLADFDDALRVDVPCHQLGADIALGSLDGGLLPGGVEAARPLVDALAADYGGSEVYNALLYGVDREVRLPREVVTDVYLPLLGEQVGAEIRLDRSERRF